MALFMSGWLCLTIKRYVFFAKVLMRSKWLNDKKLVSFLIEHLLNDFNGCIFIKLMQRKRHKREESLHRWGSGVIELS